MKSRLYLRNLFIFPLTLSLIFSAYAQNAEDKKSLEVPAFIIEVKDEKKSEIIAVPEKIESLEELSKIDGVNVTSMVERITPKTAQTESTNKAKALINRIPADGLYVPRKEFRIKNDVKIEKFSSSNPFFGTDNVVPDAGLPKELNLEVSNKNNDHATLDFFLQANEALNSGMNEVAISYYKKILAREGNNRKALLGLAVSYQKSGQLEQAKNIYVDMIMENQKDFPAMNNFLVLMSEEAPDDALRHLTELEKNNIEYAPIPAQIATLYVRKGDYARAAAKYKRAVTIDPSNLEYRYNLALMMEMIGNNRAAASLYKSLLEQASSGAKLPKSYVFIRDRLESAIAKQL